MSYYIVFSGVFMFSISAIFFLGYWSIEYLFFMTYYFHFILLPMKLSKLEDNFMTVYESGKRKDDFGVLNGEILECTRYIEG